MWCTERPRRTARPARGVPWRPGSDDDTRSWAMGELLARVSRRATRAQVHHVTPVLADRAGGLVAEVYRQVERDFGMLAPPIALHAPAPETLLPARQGLQADAPTRGRATPTRPPHHRPQHRTCRCCGITSDGIVTEIPRIP